MRARALLSLTSACLLAACAHPDRTYMGVDMAWSLDNSEGEGLKLSLAEAGQPARLTLTCRPGSGQVRIALSTDADAAPSLALASKDRSAGYPAQVGPNLGDGAVVEAVTGTADPVLEGFAGGGVLIVGPPSHRLVTPRAPRARDFMDACRPQA